MLVWLKIFLSTLVAIALALPLFYPSMSSGFIQEMQAVGMYGAIAIVIGFLVLVFFYCKDLQKILELVKPEHRAASPKSVWLMFLIPYNFVEDFFIVYHVSKSIEREVASGALLLHSKYYGLVSGLGWCSAQIFSIFPGVLGQLGGAVALVLWVLHWYFIRKVIRLLS